MVETRRMTELACAGNRGTAQQTGRVVFDNMHKSFGSPEPRRHWNHTDEYRFVGEEPFHTTHKQFFS